MMGVWSSGHVTCLVLRRRENAHGASGAWLSVSCRWRADLSLVAARAGMRCLRTIAEARADARSRSTHARLLDRTAAALCEAGRRELQGRTATARGVERLQVCSGGRLCLVQGKGRCSTLKRVEARFCWRDETDRRMWAREERPYQQRPAQGSQSWHWRTRGGEASREQIADSGWTLAWLGSGMRRSCVETWAALRNAARRRRGEAFAIIYLFARFSASVYPSGRERMRYVHASVLTATHTPDETDCYRTPPSDLPGEVRCEPVRVHRKWVASRLELAHPAAALAGTHQRV